MGPRYDVVIVGAGPAGLTAALGAAEAGARRICILERGKHPGGILRQCIHPGFGLQYFGEELTGPEYAERLLKITKKTSAIIRTETMVLEIGKGFVCVSGKCCGFEKIKFGALIIATGCRERPRGAAGIPGDRPAGVMTAGTAQYFMNIEGRTVGKKAVILGSGDIGLIMARRLVFEGIDVAGVFEINPWAGGLNRNVVQCLYDYHIPLHLGYRVTDISGNGRLKSVTAAEVGDGGRLIPGTSREIACDTLLLSVGLIPENELLRSAGIQMDVETGGALTDSDWQTSDPSVFACGNALAVHDLADDVSVQSYDAGKNAAASLNMKIPDKKFLQLKSGKGIRLLFPKRLVCGSGSLTVFYRLAYPVDNGRVELASADGKCLRSRRLRYCMPGEMQKFRIPENLLTAETGILTLNVCREDEE